MKEVVLLGAGASVEAGIKDASNMTQQFAELFARDLALRRQSHALHYVIGGLMLQKGAKGESPYDGINIEDVFNAMNMLAARELFEAAPFVMGWHPVVEEIHPVVKQDVSVTTQSVNSFAARNIDDAIRQMIQNKFGHRSVGQEIREMIENSLRHLSISVSQGGERSGGGQVFRATCDTMIRKLISLVWLDDDKRDVVEYLRPLVRHAHRNNVSIATLNYDNTIELAAAAEGARVFEEMGEVLSSEEEVDQAAKGYVHLLKLHGSIDWYSLPPGSNDGLPATQIRRANREEMLKPRYMPAVIFGQRNKLTAEGPYLRLLSSFRDSLAEADSITVIGYSFRDPHVNEFIATWFNAVPTRSITVVTPDRRWANQSDLPVEFLRCRTELESSRRRPVKRFPNCFLNGTVEPAISMQSFNA